MIGALDMSGLSKKWFDNLWLIWSINGHLSTYENLVLAELVSHFQCSLLMNVWRLSMAPPCVVVGQLANQ